MATRSGAEPTPREPDEADLYTAAHRLWWTMKGDALPADPSERNALWAHEEAAMLRLMRQVWRHLEYNGLELRSRPASADI